MFSTDGALTEDNLVVLRDDRHLQPAENLTPLVRHDAVQRFGPGLADALDQVSALLTTDDVRDLNAQVADGSDPSTVAHAWLEAHGLAALTVDGPTGE